MAIRGKDLMYLPVRVVRTETREDDNEKIWVLVEALITSDELLSIWVHEERLVSSLEAIES